MTSDAFSSAAEGRSVLISETGVERLQLVARAGTSTFLLGGSRTDGGLTSGPNPYEVMAAALGACTAMALRMFAEHKGYQLDRLEVSVVHHRGSLTARDRFERIIVIEGKFDERQRERLLQAANTCPVGLSLARAADMETSLSPKADPLPMSPAASDYTRDLKAAVDAEEIDLLRAAADLGSGE